MEKKKYVGKKSNKRKFFHIKLRGVLFQHGTDSERFLAAIVSTANYFRRDYFVRNTIIITTIITDLPRRVPIQSLISTLTVRL